jgi:hypothetical protein
MAENAAAFDEPTARDLIAMLRWWRGQPKFRPQGQDRGPTQSTGEHVIVKVTSTTPTDGLYPATLQTWTFATAEWTEGASCWFLPANGETPALDRRYGARRMSLNTDDEKVIYTQDLGVACFVRVKSLTKIGCFYPAVECFYDPETCQWNDGEDCWYVDANE